MSNPKTPKFRVSYPSVFKAKLNKLSGKEEFSVVALFAKDADLTELKKAAEAAVVAEWGADPKKWPAKLKTPFRDQAEKMKDGVMPAGHEAGAIFLTLRSKNRPGVVVSGKNKVTGAPELVPIEEEKDFYAGCYAIASVSVYAYDQAGNRGVSFGLVNLMKVADGDTLSASAAKPSEEFTPIPDIEAGATATALFT